ncbi:uncharacterized protein L969DRAFT_15723 [Mixia osmundae IAM 14324]|nr:uncharacterized protein L969DRAFT_15723 [Mixia osmundae IAM 14324]KEI41704.1 hypothetical protein L969DRAFT_15723 [Mixia osmundae IAM 14324]
MTKRTAPYGSWESPLSAELLTQATVDIRYVFVDSVTHEHYHIELRPSEKGRNAIVDAHGKELSSTTAYDARTRVHEYAIGCAVARNGRVVFPDFTSFDVLRTDKSSGEWSKAVSVVPRHPAYRYGDLEICPTEPDLLVAVREDHTIDEPSKVINSIVLVDMGKRETIMTLAGGCDFYTTPKLSPDGKLLSWIDYNLPNMPWDNSRANLAKFDTSTGLSDVQSIDGGLEMSYSVSQLRWSIDGSHLLWLNDSTGYYNLYAREIQSGKNDLAAGKALAHDAGAVDWFLGQSSFASLTDDLVVLSAQKSGVFNLVSLSSRSIIASFDTPFLSGQQIRRVTDEIIVLVGTGATTQSVLARIDLQLSDGKLDASITVLKETSSIKVDEGYISRAQALVAPSKAAPGMHESKPLAHMFYYAPASKDHQGPTDELPPCIVRCHGGPTSSAVSGLSWQIQYFTSRGFAFVDSNYGGSTGHGKVYRDRLQKNWGIVDIEDTVACVEHLAKTMIDRKRVAIVGGSAGGYTVLASLCAYPDVFAAGCSQYGVADLKGLADETHKFESEYLFGLLGGRPSEVPDVYRDRSPIYNADKIRSPLLVLQGEVDKVVPRSQAHAIVKAVRANGVECKYIEFEGEGHGFIRSENIRTTFDEQLKFYRSVFKIADS